MKSMFKEIITILVVLSSVLFAAGTYAGPLTDKEQKYFQAWAENPDARNEVRALYFADVSLQVAESQQAMPVVLSEYTILFSIELVETTVSYHYLMAYASTDEVTISYQDAQKNLVEASCADAQVAFFLTVMGGQQEFHYYLRDGKTKFVEHVITGNDCQGNSI